MKKNKGNPVVNHMIIFQIHECHAGKVTERITARFAIKIGTGRYQGYILWLTDGFYDFRNFGAPSSSELTKILEK